MAAPTKLGLDLKSLTNLPPLDLNFSTTPNEILNDIPDVSNTLVPYLTFLILMLLLVIMYVSLSDRTNFGKFLYSDLRSAVLSFGICTIMGLVGIQVKYFHDYKAVVFFGSMFTILFMIMVAVENKE